MENGKEVEGPQEFYIMSHREYKDMITTRDEKIRKEAERLQRERELLELRRKKQLERAAAFAKLQGMVGSMKLDFGGTMQEVHEKSNDKKVSGTYKPSNLPTGIIKSARQSYRIEKNELLTTGKVFKYNENTLTIKDKIKKRSERPESMVDQFNKNLLTYDVEPVDPRKKDEEVVGQKTKLPVKQNKLIRTSIQKKFLAPPPVGKTMGHGLMPPQSKYKSPVMKAKKT